MKTYAMSISKQDFFLSCLLVGVVIGLLYHGFFSLPAYKTGNGGFFLLKR